ncbi:MAG: hypothetical protein ACK5LS_00495 [Propioniciclava sp.]
MTQRTVLGRGISAATLGLLVGLTGLAAPAFAEEPVTPSGPPTSTPREANGSSPNRSTPLPTTGPSRPQTPLVDAPTDEMPGAVTIHSPTDDRDPNPDWPMISVLDAEGEAVVGAVIDFTVCTGPGESRDSGCVTASDVLSDQERTLTAAESDLLRRTVTLGPDVANLRLEVVVTSDADRPTGKAHVAGPSWVTPGDGDPRDGILTITAANPTEPGRPPVEIVAPTDDPNPDVKGDPEADWPLIQIFDEGGRRVTGTRVDFIVCSPNAQAQNCARARQVLTEEQRTLTTSPSDLLRHTVTLQNPQAPVTLTVIAESLEGSPSVSASRTGGRWTTTGNPDDGIVTFGEPPVAITPPTVSADPNPVPDPAQLPLVRVDDDEGTPVSEAVVDFEVCVNQPAADEYCADSREVESMTEGDRTLATGPDDILRRTVTLAPELAESPADGVEVTLTVVSPSAVGAPPPTARAFVRGAVWVTDDADDSDGILTIITARQGTDPQPPSPTAPTPTSSATPTTVPSVSAPTSGSRSPVPPRTDPGAGMGLPAPLPQVAPPPVAPDLEAPEPAEGEDPETAEPDEGDPSTEPANPNNPTNTPTGPGGDHEPSLVQALLDAPATAVFGGAAVVTLAVLFLAPPR